MDSCLNLELGMLTVFIYTKDSGNEVVLEKLDYLKELIMNQRDNLNIGVEPRYNVLVRWGYLILILEKNVID